MDRLKPAALKARVTAWLSLPGYVRASPAGIESLAGLFADITGQTVVGCTPCKFNDMLRVLMAFEQGETIRVERMTVKFKDKYRGQIANVHGSKIGEDNLTPANVAVLKATGFSSWLEEEAPCPPAAEPAPATEPEPAEDPAPAPAKKGRPRKQH